MRAFRDKSEIRLYLFDVTSKRDLYCGGGLPDRCAAVQQCDVLTGPDPSICNESSQFGNIGDMEVFR
jgi:hypothetical protein